MEDNTAVYLGDSVYGEVENGMLKLSTRNGMPGDPSNVIYLEEKVYRRLVEWVTKMEQEDKEEKFIDLSAY